MSTETRRIQFDFVARDRGVQRTTQQTGDAIEDMNQQTEQGAGKMGKLGAVAAKLGPVLGTLAGAAALVGPAIAKGLDAQEATAKMQAQLGVTAQESKRIGGVAGKLYSKAYGESMDDVRVAITAVIRNMDGMRTASSADLQAMSARAMTLADVMDEDVGRVTASVSQIMRTGLARNAEEAFDIITRGAQLGGNKAEDLADTFEEYSVHFKNMGLDGKQAMGLIVQGLQAGGRNADLVADTIKEFSIEAVAGGERVMKGFRSLGLDAGKMSAEFGKGGASSAKALDLVLDKLRAIKDPVKRNQVAIELFGTKAEDMGQALFALDPSAATKKLGQFADATDKAGNALHGTFKSRLTAFKRTVETQVTKVADQAVQSLARFGGEIKKGFQLPKGGTATNDFQKFGLELRKIADWTRTKLIPALKDFATFIQKEIAPQIMKFYKGVLRELWSQLRRIYGEITKGDIPWAKILKVLKEVAAFLSKHFLKLYGTQLQWALKIVGTWIVYSIKSFKLLWKFLALGFPTIKRGIAEWKRYYQAGKGAVDALVRTLAKGTAAMVRMFLQFAVSVTRGASKAFGWVPGLGGKLKKAADEVEKFQRKTNREISKITKGKNVRIRVTASGSWSAHGQGGGTQKSFGMAKGGQVWSTAPGASQAHDSVPAMLRLNEHVWTPEEVQEVGGHGAMYRLRAAARKGLLRGYADGGAVGVRPSVSTPRMTPIWNRIGAGMWAMVKKVADALAKMGGAFGVVNAARSMIGYPYSWGGGGKGGPSFGIGRGAGTFGFDCSGLTEYAWWKGAGKSIGGTTFTQFPFSRPSARRPGALGFPHLNHVVLASDRPGYIIEAPFTGAHVRERRGGSGYMWRWPFYAGGAVGQAGRAAMAGASWQQRAAAALGLMGNPGRRRGRGGRVSFGAPYLVGELGPEVHVPGGAGTVYSSGTKVVTVHQNIAVTVEVPPTANKGAVGKEINDCLLEYKRRGGRLATAGGRNG